MSKKPAQKKRHRGRTFLLDQLPDDIWPAAQARAEKEGHTLKWVILQLVADYVKHGLKVKS